MGAGLIALAAWTLIHAGNGVRYEADLTTVRQADGVTSVWVKAHFASGQKSRLFSQPYGMTNELFHIKCAEGLGGISRVDYFNGFAKLGGVEIAQQAVVYFRIRPESWTHKLQRAVCAT